MNQRVHKEPSHETQVILRSVPLAAAYSIASVHMLAGQAKQPRIAFGGISIECSTYSELRTRVEDFTVMRGEQLRSSSTFAFLSRYPMPFMPTLDAVATPGGQLDRATYDTIKADFLQRLKALLPLNLAQQYWDARKDFKWGTTICSLEECVQKAVSAKTQPAILADSGDNDTAGGVGDRADALRELLRVKANGVVLAGIADRPATDACYKAGVATTIPLLIGATLDSRASKPVKLHATVKFLLKTDTPRLREAVVQVEGITVVLGAYRRPYHDIIDFTRLGLQPKSFKIIVVKSGISHLSWTR